MPYIKRDDISNQRNKKVNEDLFPTEIVTKNDLGVVKVPIYIYNVGPIEHRTGNTPPILIRACPKEQDYILASTQYHPSQELNVDQNGRQYVENVDGFRYTTKILSPMNPGIDQNFSEEAGTEIAVGSNLNDYGVFWSKNEKPSEQELTAARARLEKTLKKELARMNDLESLKPELAAEGKNRISSIAADYFGQTTSWHRTDYKKRDALEDYACPECGEAIKKAAKYCRYCDPNKVNVLPVWLKNNPQVELKKVKSV